jgi:molybdopterin synthase sulfur carrier subunit
MKLLYFAWVRQKTGIAEEDFTPPAHVKTLRDLMALLRARGGGYAEAFGDEARLRAAVNQTHMGFDTAIGPNDEIAFFPPVTGG